MVDLLIYLLILCVVFGLIYWVVQQLPLPEPFGRIARVVIVVIGCIALLMVLLNVLGYSGGLGLRRL
jgi:hypothetical protein